MVEYLENDLRGRQRRPWICSLCRWQSQLLGLRTNSGGWRDLPHFSILPWPSAFLPALSLPFGIFSSWTPISNSFFVFSFYERSSWHGVIVTLLWRSGEGKYVHLEKVTLHRKVTLPWGVKPQLWSCPYVRVWVAFEVKWWGLSQRKLISSFTSEQRKEHALGGGCNLVHLPSVPSQ